MSFARRLNRWLVHTDAMGRQWPPGGGRGGRWTQPDETEVAIVSDGDALDLYVGKSRIYNVTLTPQAARRLAWWIIRWWMWACLFGIKTRLWTWTQQRILDEHAKSKTPGRVGGAPPWG